jgi:SPW repeat
MATPLSRRPEPGDQSPQEIVTGFAATTYLQSATEPGVAGQAAAALALLTGLWVALSPLFIVLQHGGTNASSADVIAGLVAAGAAAFALASPRGFAGLEFGSVLLGAWVIVSSFILDAKFAIATPMYWSNTFSGAVLVLLGLAGLASMRRATN